MRAANVLLFELFGVVCQSDSRYFVKARLVLEPIFSQEFTFASMLRRNASRRMLESSMIPEVL